VIDKKRVALEGKRMMEKVRREIEVLRHLKHPNVLRLFGVYETQGEIMLEMEYAAGGDLFDLVGEKNKVYFSFYY